MTDLSPQAQAIVDAYERTTDKYAVLAEVARAIADELGYYLFLLGNDCKVIDASVLYKVANKLEMKND